MPDNNKSAEEIAARFTQFNTAEYDVLLKALKAYAAQEWVEQREAINIIFDGPPSHEAGRFVEVETDDGKSINVGEWIQQPGRYWALRIASAISQPEAKG